MVRVDGFATSVSATAFGSGASRPAADPGGRYAFIRLDVADVESGSLWLAPALDNGGEEIAIPFDARPATASFAPEPGALVIGQAEPGGVWLLDLATGGGRRLSADGWLPRWLP